MGKLGEHYYTIERVIRDSRWRQLEIVSDLRSGLKEVIEHLHRGEAEKAFLRAKLLDAESERLEDALFESVAEADKSLPKSGEG